MNLEEFKELYDECGEVVAKLRVSELQAPLEDVAAKFPQALPLMSLSPYVWSNLMIKHPEVTNFYDLNKFDGHCWAWLLAANPAYVDQCPWDKLDGSDWFFVLTSQPALSRFFNQLADDRKAELLKQTKFISEVLVEQ